MSANKFLETVLDHSIPYHIAQNVFAPGHQFSIVKHIRKNLAALPTGEKILDVGCGPASWLWRADLKPTGLDHSENYATSWKQRSQEYVVGSADALPFANHSFDGIWSIFLFHHLTDEQVRHALSEMERVCKPGGYISIFDGIYPDRWWQNPVAHAIRRADRGQFMRLERDLEALFPNQSAWTFERWTYCLTGLEMISATRILAS
ncbi:methyltransferase domain-containing protein [bacterium]|nr:methyltransferase domain-containing protein [bacterium]